MPPFDVACVIWRRHWVNDRGETWETIHFCEGDGVRHVGRSVFEVNLGAEGWVTVFLYGIELGDVTVFSRTPP